MRVSDQTGRQLGRTAAKILRGDLEAHEPRTTNARGSNSYQASCQSSVISAFSTLEIGQPALAPSAIFWN